MRKCAHGFALHLLLVGVLATVVPITGCGLKGPLYRPGEKGHQSSGTSATATKPPMSNRAPAPQSQKTQTPPTTDPPPTVDPDRPADPSGAP